MQKIIYNERHTFYLDAAAATPLDPIVLKAMLPYLQKNYANPSSLYLLGQEAKAAVEAARATIAVILNAKPNEIIFTSGGTESINLAIKGIAYGKGKGHIITSAIEHPAVLEVCRCLQQRGFSATYLPVDKYGLVNPLAVEQAIRRDTILISIMYANNEVGTIQPLKEIAALAKKHKIPFHTDACQAGNLELDVEKLKVDLLSLNGAKIYGPKGIGLLYKRLGTNLEPLLHGGGQESAVRSGTENVPGIIGLAKALELVQHNQPQENKRQASMRDYLIRKILREISSSSLNGHPLQRIPGNANISFAGVEAEAVVQYLSQKGIYVSSGSACSSHQIEVSHILKAIKAPYPLGAVRFSFGKEITQKELDYVVNVLKGVILYLRKINEQKP